MNPSAVFSELENLWTRLMCETLPPLRKRIPIAIIGPPCLEHPGRPWIQLGTMSLPWTELPLKTSQTMLPPPLGS